MADVNRGNRPLSPFMLGKDYRLQLNSALSLAHRITGIGMALAAVMTVFWFLGLAYGPESFRTVDDLVTSWIGGLVLLGSVAALWFHLLNGVRHLVWDTGHGLEIEQTDLSGKAILAATAVLTLLTWILSY